MKRYIFAVLSVVILLCGCSHFKTKKTQDLLIERPSIKDAVKEGTFYTIIYFDIYSYEFDIEDEDSLMRAARLQAVLKKNIYLSGHADKTGEKKKNTELSRQRVEAVKEYLIRLGVSEDNIFAEYFGDDQPAEEGETFDIYAKNRRVELIFMSKNLNDPVLEESAAEAPAAGENDKYPDAENSGAVENKTDEIQPS